MDFSTQFIKILDELGKRFGIIVDWSNKNIMPYAKDLAHRLVQYEIATSWVTIIVSLLILVALLCLVYMDLKHWETYATAFFSGLFAILCVGVIIAETYSIVEATYLPEKVIIRELQKTYDSLD